MADQPAYLAYGSCFACGRPFGFNPQRVPSVPIDPATGEVKAGGERQPICRDCATLANQRRKTKGLPLWDTSDAAYAPVEGLPE